MKKSVWRASFSRYGVPRYPCPTCSVGHLRLNKGDIHDRRPKYVTPDSFQEDPAGIRERFIAFLTCDNANCGEAVSVAGEVWYVPEGDPEGSWEWVERFAPSSMAPSPHIIAIPHGVPVQVRSEISLACQLFWADYRVSASRLRTSLERLMDHFGVPKFRIHNNPNTRYPWEAKATRFISTHRQASA